MILSGPGIALNLSYLAFLLFLLLMPPFFVMDQTSGGSIHAPLGHHLFWNPPDAEEAMQVLYKKLPEATSDMEKKKQPGCYMVSLNKIRLVIFVIFGTATYLLARFVLKRMVINGSKRT